MEAQKSGSRKQLLSVVFSVAVVAAAVLLFTYKQEIQDQLVLAEYDVPADIAALADRASLSKRGEDLFFVNRPELHGKSSFSDRCQGVGDEQSNVLGCFTGSRIYLYDVPDERLEGVEEVTAAHEMLHAAYIRLRSSERQRIDGLIERQMDAELEPHVRELIGIYERIEPDAIINEMHSILATEQASLLPELEAYFGQYFDRRARVVELSAEYRAVFDSLKQQQETLSAQLDQLASTINNSTEDLNNRVAIYNSDVASFNNRAESGAMTSEEFDRERAVLENERLLIDQAISANDALRDEYESKRRQYESLSVEFSGLQNSINSKPVAPEAVR